MPGNWSVQENQVLKEYSDYGAGTYCTENTFGTMRILPSTANETDATLQFNAMSTDDDIVGAVWRYNDPNNYYKFVMSQEFDCASIIRM